MTKARLSLRERKLRKKLRDALPHNRKRRQKRLVTWKIERRIAKAGRPPPKRCELCRRPTKKLRFDHDHKTGQFRGWICNPCNTGLGKLGDNVKGLERALAYLRRAAP